MRLKRTIILAAVFCSVVFYSNNSFAQEQKMQDLINNFQIDDLSRNDLQSYSKRSDSLDGFLMCLAAMRNDISLCDSMSFPSYCRNRFKELHGFYKELVLSKTTSPATVNLLLAFSKMGLQYANVWVNSFLAKDTAICKDINTSEEQRECRAIMQRSPQLCPSDNCSDKVYYIKAIEEENVQACDKIKHEGVKMLCKGEFPKDENACKQCKGFKKFIKEYYGISQAEEGK